MTIPSRATIDTRRENVNQRLLFFYFGFSSLTLASRTPEIKHNLDVQNGIFGVLVSLSALGALIAFTFVGQMVHTIGVGPVLSVTSILLFGSISIIPHVHSIWKYTVLNIILGLSFNAHFIVLHDQAIRRQLINRKKSIPSLHGSFSLGCLLTTILSLLITPHVSLTWHVDILMGILFIGTIHSIIRMRTFLIRGSKADEYGLPVSSTHVWSLLRSDRYIAIAYVCAVMVEFSTNDWITLLSHQENGASSTLSIVPYLIFIVGMVTGRLGFHKLPGSKPDIFWIRISSRLGGIGFVAFLLLSKSFSHRNFAAAFAFETLAFLIGGLGGSFLAGVLTQIATERSNLPAGMVVAQLSFALTVLTLLLRLMISVIIQLTSITFGLMIPGALMIALSFFTQLGPPASSSDSSSKVS